MIYYAQTNYLNIHQIADNWSKEFGARPAKQILQIIIDAFWSEEFESHKNEMSKLADPKVTFEVVRDLGGVPWGLTGIKDEEEPTMQHLVGIPTHKYGAGGQNILANLKFDKDMIGSWCSLNNIEKPSFWFLKKATKTTKKTGITVIEKYPPKSKTGRPAHPLKSDGWAYMCKIGERSGAERFKNESDLAEDIIIHLRADRELNRDQVRKWVSDFKKLNNLK